jgi:hypothetical protein
MLNCYRKNAAVKHCRRKKEIEMKERARTGGATGTIARAAQQAAIGTGSLFCPIRAAVRVR